jgi:tetratricopeptide (TPR) repeat protein
MRREIEQAMELERNIVPLLVNNFSYSGAETYLTGKLGQLQRYNAIAVPHEYFDEAMQRLRTRYLKSPEHHIKLTPTSTREYETVERQMTEVSSQPPPTAQQLSAEEQYDHSWTKWESKDWQGVIADCTEAVRLNPQFASAYMRRSGAKINLGDHEGAIADATLSIDLNPTDARAFYNRGKAQQNLGNYEEALADYGRAVQLNPQYVLALDNRAGAYYDTGDYEAAVADWSEAIRLKPDDASTYNNRGEAYFARGEAAKALGDFAVAVQFDSQSKHALAGLAITYHALGLFNKAQESWKVLAGQNTNFQDADWVKKDLNWAEPLVEEARKLIASL